jgi:hypothetical protein
MSQSDEQVEVNDNEVCDDDETEIATHSKILAEMYRIKFYMLGHSDVYSHQDIAVINTITRKCRQATQMTMKQSVLDDFFVPCIKLDR